MKESVQEVLIQRVSVQAQSVHHTGHTGLSGPIENSSEAQSSGAQEGAWTSPLLSSILCAPSALHTANTKGHSKYFM